MKRSSCGIRGFRRSILLTALALSIGGAERAAAQTPWDPAEARVSREDLERRLELYEQAAASTGYSTELRAEAADAASRIRTRLETGDLRAGDRLFIVVENHPALTDTFAVTENQRVTLPDIGEIDLTGALRTELQERVATSVARIIRNPEVRTRALVRVMVDGAVAAPGYYLVDSDMPLSDVLMRAGGHASHARLDAARVLRGTDVVVVPMEFREALRAGATIDHLGLREGDRLFVPGRERDWLATARDLVYIIPAVIGLTSLIL